MSLIKYSFWLDHPIGKGMSFFLGFLAITFGFININTLGRYGYGMGFDGLWFLLLGLIHVGFNVKYGVVNGLWRVEYYLYSVKLKCREYADAKLESDGKLYRLHFLDKERFVPSPIAFSEDSVLIIRGLFEKR